MAAVSVEDVRDVLHADDSDIPEAKVLKMIKRAEVTLELELSEDLDYADCTDAQKETMTVLAAIYALCFLTGGSSIGLSFRVGDLSATQSSSLPALEVLQGEFERLLTSLKTPYVGSV
ncbi:MAG: hypothetical protein NWF00_04885 [Candidatus Bathyarchaeota archaeon]|nr:hypothetical protein [Candidatus Bathyarchaeota archaeon]